MTHLQLRNRPQLGFFFSRNEEESLMSSEAYARLNRKPSSSGKLSLSMGDILPMLDEREAGLSTEDTKNNSLEDKWMALFRMRDWRGSTDLIELMREGIPDKLRGKVWKVFLRSEEMKKEYPKHYYQSLVKLSKEVQAHDRKDIFQIDKDLGRTMPKNKAFQTKEGLEKLKRVLYAYALRNPDVVGYCQGMNFICAGLLTVLGEEEAFWAFCVLIESRLGYYTATMISLKVDQSCLNRMISFKSPKVYSHMIKLGVSIHSFTTAWLLCLFMENPLPYETAIKYWDYLFCYGDEMLFHMALEILLHRSEELLAIEDADEMLEFTLHRLSKNVNALSLERITKKIGTLVNEITMLRSYYQKAETIAAADQRLDCATLASKFKFDSAEEVHHLWKLFVAPEPWDILLTNSHTEVSWFAYTLHRACYPKEPDSFCAHGLLSGLIHRLFDILDVHNTGNVTFKKFLKTIHILRYGTREERLKLCFEFYDFDGDGAIGLSDLKIGAQLITSMIEGGTSCEDNERRVNLCRDMIYRAYLLNEAEEKFVVKKFESGPFGLQLTTRSYGDYPMVKKILIETTQDMGIEVGWQLISINEVSFQNFDDNKIYETMKGVMYPALATFRMLKFPHRNGSTVRSPSEEEKRTLSLEKFSQVIQMHAKTKALFRLHGAVLEHWRPPDPKTAEVKRNKTQSKRTSGGSLGDWWKKISVRRNRATGNP
uniref:Rab-GAP TBC domain-containing protein n=3 Tax=Lotharella globosa TaxID=91324 RepID=A0A7S4DIU8_9EUKA